MSSAEFGFRPAAFSLVTGKRSLRQHGTVDDPHEVVAAINNARGET
jgi:hypothetical protein